MVKELSVTHDTNIFPVDYNGKGRPVIWLAAKDKQWGLVKELSYKSDLNIFTSGYKIDSETIIWLAAKDKQWSLVKHLSVKSDITLFPSKENVESIIWLAANDKQWSLVKELALKAELNISPSNINTDYKTVIWLAAEDMQWDLVYNLSLLGADPCISPSKFVQFDQFFRKNRSYQITLLMLWASDGNEDLQALANSTSLNRRVNKPATNSASLYLYRKSINICNDLKTMPFQQIADMNVKDNSITRLERLPQSILNIIATHWLIEVINRNMNYTTPHNFPTEQQFFLNKIITKNFRSDESNRNLKLINKENLKSLIQTHNDLIFSNILSCFRRNTNLHGMEPFILPPVPSEPQNESEPVLEHNQIKGSSCFPGILSLFKSNQKKREPNIDKVCANKSKDKARPPNDTVGTSINSRVIQKAQINKNNCKQSFYEVYDRRKMLLSIQAKEDKLFFTNFERKQIYHIAQTMEKIEGCETTTPDNIGAYFKKALSI